MPHRGRSTLIVRTTPRVDDPRELQTILTCSLRSLWGDLEAHSCGVNVERAAHSADESDAKGMAWFKVSCRPDSVDAVRASLTWVTPPPYLEDVVYRFDVVDIQTVTDNN